MAVWNLQIFCPGDLSCPLRVIPSQFSLPTETCGVLPGHGVEVGFAHSRGETILGSAPQVTAQWPSLSLCQFLHLLNKVMASNPQGNCEAFKA